VSCEYPTVVYLSREDFPRLLEAELQPRTQIAVRLGLKCGLRPVEIRYVRLGDVHAGQRQIHLAYCGRSKPRTVPIDQETLDLIDDYEGDSNPCQPILRSSPGYQMRSGPVLSETLLCGLVKEAAKAAGIASWQRFYPNLLRHHFAADWVVRKGNIYMLQRILGHRYISTTTVYLKRLIYWEDVIGEYDRIKGGTRKMEETDFYLKWCSKCEHEPVCGFYRAAEQICHLEHGCRQFKRREKP